ncbi:MAG: addiction module protein [Myxococcales bacterium]|nr:addiction module protein [Myxococcales bacterium]
MATISKTELIKLDIAQRLELIEELRESIVDESNEGATLPLSAADRELLEQRLREDDEDPDAAIPWSEAKARLRQPRAIR